METKNKITVATADQVKAFTKGDVVLDSSNPRLWQIEESSAVWIEAQLAQSSSDKKPYLKNINPMFNVPFFRTISNEDFEYIPVLASQLEVTPENPVSVFIKVVKSRPLQLDKALVEARYSDNKSAIANWKAAIAAGPNAARYFAAVISED